MYTVEFFQTTTNTTIISFIRNAIVSAINNSCQCNFQEVYITNEHTYCDMLSPTQAIYRAEITRFKTFSPNQLVSIIEQWVQSKPSLRSGSAIVTFNTTNCPVRVTSMNEPICGSFLQSSRQSPLVTITFSTLNDVAILTPLTYILIALLVAVLLVVLILFLILLCKRKKNK